MTKEQAIEVLNEILDLLEPIEPREIVNKKLCVGDPHRTIGWRCGKCGRGIGGADNYCSNCGKPVKWDD